MSLENLFRIRPKTKKNKYKKTNRNKRQADVHVIDVIQLKKCSTAEVALNLKSTGCRSNKISSRHKMMK